MKKEESAGSSIVHWMIHPKFIFKRESSANHSNMFDSIGAASMYGGGDFLMAASSFFNRWYASLDAMAQHWRKWRKGTEKRERHKKGKGEGMRDWKKEEVQMERRRRRGEVEVFPFSFFFFLLSFWFFFFFLLPHSFNQSPLIPWWRSPCLQSFKRKIFSSRFLFLSNHLQF